jgi:hypothetical protein
VVTKSSDSQRIAVANITGTVFAALLLYAHMCLQQYCYTRTCKFGVIVMRAPAFALAALLLHVHICLQHNCYTRTCTCGITVTHSSSLATVLEHTPWYNSIYIFMLTRFHMRHNCAIMNAHLYLWYIYAFMLTRFHLRHNCAILDAHLYLWYYEFMLTCSYLRHYCATMNSHLYLWYQYDITVRHYCAIMDAHLYLWYQCGECIQARLDPCQRFWASVCQLHRV